MANVFVGIDLGLFIKEMLTKKQKLLNKKARFIQTKSYALKIARKELQEKDIKWKQAVKQEFGFKCSICGKNEIVHVHHLLPREIKAFRHIVLNGICLCPLHHKFSLEISPHRNPIVFYNWYLTSFKDRYDKLLSLYKMSRLNEMGNSYMNKSGVKEYILNHK